MSTTVNHTVNGIQFDNVQFIDVSKQPYCPLEGTDLEGACQNAYHNIQLRDDAVCVHSEACAALLSTVK